MSKERFGCDEFGFVNLKSQCYFCGRAESEGRSLLSGLNASICPDCVHINAKSFNEIKKSNPELRCSFCGSDNRDLAFGQEARICEGCINLSKEIISERKSSSQEGH